MKHFIQAGFKQQFSSQVAFQALPAYLFALYKQRLAKLSQLADVHHAGCQWLARPYLGAVDCVSPALVSYFSFAQNTLKEGIRKGKGQDFSYPLSFERHRDRPRDRSPDRPSWCCSSKQASRGSVLAPCRGGLWHKNKNKWLTEQRVNVKTDNKVYFCWYLHAFVSEYRAKPCGDEMQTGVWCYLTPINLTLSPLVATIQNCWVQTHSVALSRNGAFSL